MVLPLKIAFYSSYWKSQASLVEEKENGEAPASPLTYCVERLIRGLASTRETSIQGFFICLVELLRQHANTSEEASVDKVLETISKVLHVKGSKSVRFFAVLLMQNFHYRFILGKCQKFGSKSGYLSYCSSLENSMRHSSGLSTTKAVLPCYLCPLTPLPGFVIIT